MANIITPIFATGHPKDIKAVVSTSTYNPDGGEVGNCLFGSTPSNWLYVGGNGALDVVLYGGRVTVRLTNVFAGLWQPMPPFIHINNSGNASSIVVGVSWG